jgi:4-hydroxybenzoate polyprenyltransferase
MTGWVVLVRERFPPASYLPMLVLFVAGNATAASSATGVPLDAWRLAAAFAISLSFFLRLRCLDEIQDYPTDVRINPTRPLPRGVLSVAQVRRGALVLAGIELAAAAALGLPIAIAHAIAVGYSLLMYREFFVGRWLRPHLTTYAVTHTFVSVLLGGSIMVQTTGTSIADLPASLLAFGAINWGLFNLFEFARKTFAPGEERPGVDSYSSLFRPTGAVLLSLSQIGIAVGAIWFASGSVFADGAALWHTPLVALFAATALVYAVRRGPVAAAFLRGSAGITIVGCYAVMTWQLWSW